MTIRVNTTVWPERTNAPAAHAYSIPIVRGLPIPPAHRVDDCTW